MDSQILRGERTVPTSTGRAFKPGKGLTPAERLELEEIRTTCLVWLEPLDSDGIAACVMPLVASMPSASAGDMAQFRAAAYVVALEGQPRNALEIACRQVLRGDVEGLSRRFAPTPPELAKLTRDAASVWRGRLRNVEELLAMPELRAASVA